MKIKNWGNFQHLKDRDPIWIKLYRKLLDDIEWHNLSGDDAKILIMLWLLASESKGTLPDVKEISFRLRLPEARINKAISNLSHWIEMSDTILIPNELQDDALEKRRERDREEKRKRRMCSKILQHLNKKANKKFREVDSNINIIKERINEGYEEKDFYEAIGNQVRCWLDDEKMNAFLRPSTIFQKSKFDGYVNNTNIRKINNDIPGVI